jgi:hypothetical protein
LKVNGKIDNPRWKTIPCKCNHDSIETEFPIAKCVHCEMQAKEDSLPKENFKVNEIKISTNDKGEEIRTTQTRTIKEVTIVRGKSGYQEILGWTW